MKGFIEVTGYNENAEKVKLFLSIDKIFMIEDNLIWTVFTHSIKTVKGELIEDFKQFNVIETYEEIKELIKNAQ